jgi:hypothetical protein
MQNVRTKVLRLGFPALVESAREASLPFDWLRAPLRRLRVGGEPR